MRGRESEKTFGQERVEFRVLAESGYVGMLRLLPPERSQAGDARGCARIRQFRLDDVA